MMLLSSYRVLDLSDEKGFFCGKVLGDLGADVIKIEKPGGDHSRKIGPFYNKVNDVQNSLYWFAYNSNKRGITLNIETEKGKDIFRKLVTHAHFVIESFPCGYMDDTGLGYSQLRDINPELVMISIAPFGQSGPYKDYKSSNLVAEAMGGLMYITGNTNETPFSSGFQYAYKQAGLQAASGALIANYWRQQTGRGQHVDVSIQEAVLVSIYLPQQLWYIRQIILGRYGMKTLRGEGVHPRVLYNCKDGYVLFRFMGGPMGHGTRAMVIWMNEEGFADDLKRIDWEKVDMGTVPPQELEGWEKVCESFLLTKTKSECYIQGIKRDIMVFPVNKPKDILTDVQLNAREFWVHVEHPKLGSSFVYPGIPFKWSEGSFDIRKAPNIGEHNAEVYGAELGLSIKEQNTLKEQGII